MSTVDQIILLHDIDSKLFEINKLLGGLPTQVEELIQQEETLKNSLSEKENLLKTRIPYNYINFWGLAVQGPPNTIGICNVYVCFQLRAGKVQEVNKFYGFHWK